MTRHVRFPSLFVILLAAFVANAVASETPPRPGPPTGTYAIVPAADSIRIPFEMFRERQSNFFIDVIALLFLVTALRSGG